MFSKYTYVFSLFTPILTLCIATTASAEFSETGHDSLPDASIEAETNLLSAASPTEKCALDHLKSLGWRVLPSATGTQPQIHAGTPCDSATLEEAQAKGDLVIELPAQSSGADLTSLLAMLPGLTRDSASMCAYKFKVGQSVKAATQKLAANPGLRFSGNQITFVDFGIFANEFKGWRETSFLGTSYIPNRSNARSIKTFYNESVKMECAVGLQIAQYASLYELYGDADFDRAFEKQEIVIGVWDRLAYSPSVTQGSHRGRTLNDPLAQEISQQGTQALVGISGYIGNVFGEKFLDQSADRGENYIITSVSKAAGENLKKNHGLAYYNNQARKFWDLGQKLGRQQKGFYWSALARGQSMGSSQQEREILSEMRAILADPVFSEIRVFVHPLKEMTYGMHLARLLDANPRTPYQITLYPDSVNEGLFDRYTQYQLSKCSR